MRFAHLADVHLGAWREPKLRELTCASFTLAIDTALHEHVDFVILAGDLFNTAVPAIDHLRLAVKKFKELHTHGIPVYIIAGSHDFTPAGKTMIDVLEEAGLVTNVMRGHVDEAGILKLSFVTDKKTGVKLCGLIGKKGMLDKYYYEKLDTIALEKESGQKIFVFHTALEELRPDDLQDMDAAPLSLLPRNFTYYAGGHVHIVRHGIFSDHKNVIYPGPTFPANFSELEKLGCGSMVIYDDHGYDCHISKSHISDDRLSDNHLTNDPVRLIPLHVKETKNIFIDANGKTPEEIFLEIKKASIGHADVLMIVRIQGTLVSGQPSDVGIREILNFFPQAYTVLVNKNKLASERVLVKEVSETTEKNIIREHALQKTINFGGQEEQVINQLISILSLEKQEGEKVSDYNQKIKKLAKDVLRV
jgi:exonuclease SbcD